MKRKSIISLTIVAAISMSAFAAEKKLSKSDVRGIVEQYEAALKKSVDEFPAHLFCDSSYEALRGGLFTYTRRGHVLDVKGIDEITFKSVDGNNARIKISYRDRIVDGIGGSKDQITPADKGGYLQIAPDGKIKYDPIFLSHPLEEASNLLRIMGRDYNVLVDFHEQKKLDEQEQRRVEQLTRIWTELHLRDLSTLGVPLFDLTAEKPVIEQRESLLKLAEWISKDAKTWDVSEPIIPLPEDRFKAISKQAKRMKLEKL